MNKKRTFLLTLISAVTLSLLNSCGTNSIRTTSTQSTPGELATQSTTPEQPKNQTASEAPLSNYGKLKEFTAKTLDGNSFTQNDLKKADITVINFWSTGCSPCLDEMPALAKYANSLPENINLITVCFDGDTNADTAKKILSDAGYKGITLTTGDKDFIEVTDKIEYTPTTLFIDQNGNVIGDAVIGGLEDEVAEVFSTNINNALKTIGKPEMK